MADLGALGDRAQREPLDPALGQFRLACDQKCCPQATVMIGFFIHASGLAFDLVSVKIYLT